MSAERVLCHPEERSDEGSRARLRARGIESGISRFARDDEQNRRGSSAARWLILVAMLCAAASAFAQEALSPLPPPVTRSLYRSHWFEFLSAYSDNDTAAAAKALDQMVKAARKVGVHRLSDFSRTAVFLGRRAEQAGTAEKAGRAYDAALRLDDANPDAVMARLSFLVRQRRVLDALRYLPEAARALVATRESRTAILSSLGLCLAAAIGAALLASILSLALKHSPRLLHDLRETARRRFGRGAALPLSLLILGIPLFVGLGPVWLILYWGALLYAYTEGWERRILIAGFLGLAVIPPLLAWLTEVNIRQRSPLLVAAVDLAERREDASAEDGLRQAAAVFPEDSDVWFLLGIFAERAGDLERAQGDYGRAGQADPADYRPLLNRGNVHFTEGDYSEAIRDYIEASKRAPASADVYYNLSLARSEAYDFEGQSQAIARARELSSSQVAAWSNNPTLSRVVPAEYPLGRARSRIELWNAQLKSRRLPGHGTAEPPWKALYPWSVGPLAAWLLGVVLARRRKRYGLATECSRCGRAICSRCRRYGDPTLYCAMCSRLYLRKEETDIEVQVAETKAMGRRATWRARAGRLASLLLPGSRAYFEERPRAGAITLFLFFFGLSAALIDERFFNPMTLPSQGMLRPTVVAGGLMAILVWLRAQLAARRTPSGS